ncbi:hypothetical protein [uncultured Rikenella sp.]|uniref:hypothetical protein n=1 Tax=uncultured Rikenella sp. TaxID=368003 RepID=UPI0025F4EBC8|nr:hypothetical protein [uncultured Rikenella sp.]
MSDAPAPGYRDFGRTGWEGIAKEIGNDGFSWGSTVSGASGMTFYFYSQSLLPNSVLSRGHGLQLRCLSE